MKKYISFFVLSFLLFLLVGCSSANVKIVRTQWESSDVTGTHLIINSFEEYNAYATTDGSKKLEGLYNEEFFNNSSLVLVFLSENSGSISHKVKSVKINDGVVDLTVKRKTPEIGTYDMAEWTFFIELTKNEVKTIEEVNLILK